MVCRDEPGALRRGLTYSTFRRHDVELARTARGAGAVPATVRHVRPHGAVVRLELEPGVCWDDVTTTSLVPILITPRRQPVHQNSSRFKYS